MELLRDSINIDRLTEIQEEVEALGDLQQSYLGYVRRVRVDMTREQRFLHTFLRREGRRAKVLENPLYQFAIAITYRILPDEQKQILIPRHDFNLTTANIKDQGDLDWFEDKLIKRCPEYLIWIQMRSGEIDGESEKRDFILGSYFTIMPFAQREETHSSV